MQGRGTHHWKRKDLSISRDLPVTFITWYEIYYACMNRYRPHTFCSSFSCSRDSKRQRSSSLSASSLALSPSVSPSTACFSLSSLSSLVSRLIFALSSRISFTVALVFTSFALDANCRVLLVSSMYLYGKVSASSRQIDTQEHYLSAAVTQHTTDILAFPERLGWRSRVNLLSLNETWVPGCDSAWMTRLRDKRLWLILPPSLARCPVAPVWRTDSEPAKSTRFNADTHTAVSLSCPHLSDAMLSTVSLVTC